MVDCRHWKGWKKSWNILRWTNCCNLIGLELDNNECCDINRGGYMHCTQMFAKSYPFSGRGLGSTVLYVDCWLVKVTSWLKIWYVVYWRMAVPDISNAFNIALRIQEENLIFFFSTRIRNRMMLLLMTGGVEHKCTSSALCVLTAHSISKILFLNLLLRSYPHIDLFPFSQTLHLNLNLLRAQQFHRMSHCVQVWLPAGRRERARAMLMVDFCWYIGNFKKWFHWIFSTTLGRTNSAILIVKTTAFSCPFWSLILKLVSKRSKVLLVWNRISQFFKNIFHCVRAMCIWSAVHQTPRFTDVNIHLILCDDRMVPVLSTDARAIFVFITCAFSGFCTILFWLERPECTNVTCEVGSSLYLPFFCLCAFRLCSIARTHTLSYLLFRFYFFQTLNSARATLTIFIWLNRQLRISWNTNRELEVRNEVYEK